MGSAWHSTATITVAMILSPWQSWSPRSLWSFWWLPWVSRRHYDHDHKLDYYYHYHDVLTNSRIIMITFVSTMFIFMKISPKFHHRKLKIMDCVINKIIYISRCKIFPYLAPVIFIIIITSLPFGNVATTRYPYVVCIYGAICLQILFLKHHILLFCNEIWNFLNINLDTTYIE